MGERWVAPSLSVTQEVPANLAVIVEPAGLAGRVVVSVADLFACRLEHESGAICGLVAFHKGDHWICSAELVDEVGPFAMVERRETDEERDARFTPENDRAWGSGNWVRCPTCPRDSEGREVYHHAKAHS